MFLKYPKTVIFLFFALSIAGCFTAMNRVKFVFDFEQFFPEGDDDLIFFQTFCYTLF